MSAPGQRKLLTLMDSVETAMRSAALFSDLTGSEMDQLLASSQIIRIEKNKELAFQGQPVECVYLISGGTAQASISSQSERKAAAVLSILHPGSEIGLVSVIDGAPHSVTVTALDEVEVVKIPVESIQELLETHPLWYRTIAEVAILQLRTTYGWIQNLL